MGKQATTNDTTKAAALSLLTRGLATKAEIAELAGVTRQAVQKWAADIPCDRNRKAHLATIWRKALDRGRQR